jgi:hypothetical protein
MVKLKSVGTFAPVILLAAMPAAASANPASAACAATLPGEASMIYQATVPDIRLDSNIRDIVVKKVRAMVISGQVSRATARSSAIAAGECLRLLK